MYLLPVLEAGGAGRVGPPSSRCVTWPFWHMHPCSSLCVHISCFYEDTGHIGVGTTLHASF